MPILRTTASLFIAVMGMALVSATVDLADVMPGLWRTQTAVTGQELEMLTNASANVSCYAEEVEHRICLLDVEGLETQELNGTNYKFRVAGCTVTMEKELGACSNLNCTSTPYDVIVSTFNNATLVTSILERA